MKVEPWQDSSTVSSPVNECGARKTVATASSSSSPSRTRRPKVAVCERRSASGTPERGWKKRSQSVTASGPETRTMASAPLPAGVDRAQMVEGSRWVFIRGYCFMAKVAPDIKTPSGACRAIVSVFRPPRNPFGRKPRTITPTESLWGENLAQSLHREVCGAKNSHNHPNGNHVGRKTRTITPPRSLWGERLAQSPQRESCGAKTSHNRPNGKSVSRKPRTIGPTRWFWGEKLAQSLATEVFRPVVRRRISVILWLSLSLRLSVAVSESDGRPSAWGCLRGR